MNRFWNRIILSIIKDINAKYIVEIGSDGINTKNIMEYCVENDAHLTAIDHHPNFDITDFKNKYGDKFEIYEDLSLNVLHKLNNYDVIILDGDNEGHIIYNELKIVEQNFKGKKFPIIFFKDVNLSYTRKNIYYNPETISEGHGQPYEEKEICIGESKSDLNYTLYGENCENTPNGVLTVIEDFIRESDLELSFEISDAFFGLGILFINDKKIENIVKETIENEDLTNLIEMDYLKLFIDLENALDVIYQKDNELADKELEIQNKIFEIENKEIEIQKIKDDLHKNKNLIYQKDKKIKNEKARYRKVKSELNSIRSSDFWKLATKYYKVRDHVWPFNSIYSYFKKANLQKAQENKKVKAKPKSKPKKHLTPNIKRDNSKYDVIFFSIIHYNYKYYQRPHHIADIFADKGHQVHYFNPNFTKDYTRVSEINPNLRMVNLLSEDNFISQTNLVNSFDKICKELDDYIEAYKITDCVVFIEYPNWIHLGKYLKEKYDFKIVFDVLDEFSGFHPDDHVLLESFNELFKITDLVITTSAFLYEKAAKLHQNIKLVRNGAEFRHFNISYSKDMEKNKKPVIGYYGAIMHWFDFEKIDFIAQRRPDWDLVLIGDLNDSSDPVIPKLQDMDHVHFLGPKNYNELPSYLKKFDVALIPFKQDQDLIKATNPVKFYEYLSMGKKIVSTELPELMKYKDRFVYLTNDNEQFLKYVEICVGNEDNLASEEEKIEFARTQDWENRVNEIERGMNDLYGLVSVIVVTHNNIDYTKQCLSSIFEKTAYPNYEIVIVDNNSTDGTRRYLLRLQDKYNNIKLILNDKDCGFAKAKNMGVSESSGEYIILLDNDTIVTNGWLTGLIKYLDRNKDLGLVGPVTNSIWNEAKIDVSYKNIKDIDDFSFKYKMAHINELHSTTVLAMFCLAIRREIFEKIGELDENFNISMFEGVDYSYRIRKSGYDIACAKDVFVHHFGGHSLSKVKTKEYEAIFDKNKAIFENKWNTRWVPYIRIK